MNSLFKRQLIGRVACSLIFLGVCTSSANAALTLVGYDSTNPNGSTGSPSPDLAPAEFASFLTPLDLARGPGVTPNVGVAFNSSNWSLASALDLGSDRYISWGWSDSEQALDLSSMTIQYDVSPSGPSQLAIALSTDSSAFEVVFADASVDPSDETHTIDLSAYQGIHSAVFRLYGFDADSSAGTLDIEEIVDGGQRGILVFGDVAAVPEPNVLGLFVIAAASIAVRRKDLR